MVVACAIGCRASAEKPPAARDAAPVARDAAPARPDAAVAPATDLRALIRDVKAKPVEALLAWDASGQRVHVECGDDFLPLYDLGHGILKALSTAAGPGDPVIGATLHLARAFRAADNADAIISYGLWMVGFVAEWLADHKEPWPDVYADLAPEADLVERVARAEARCQIDRARKNLTEGTPRKVLIAQRAESGLPNGEKDLQGEATRVEAFWTETLDELAKLDTNAQRAALLDRRSVVARAVTDSVLLPILGPPETASSVARAMARRY